MSLVSPAINLVVEPLAQWTHCEQVVRYCKQPSAYHLIHQYLELGAELCEEHDRTTKVKVYKRMYDQLVETICDVLLPLCWRRYCLDMLYQPTREIQRLLQTEQERNGFCVIQQRTNRLCQYFIQ